MHLHRLHRPRSSPAYVCNNFEYRHLKSHGKKQGPLYTRANECQAYVSFVFVTNHGKKAAIIRSSTTHSGHDIHNVEEQRFAHINEDLLNNIKILVDQVIVCDISLCTYLGRRIQVCVYFIMYMCLYHAQKHCII